MKIVLQNKANLSNKYVRFVMWKIYLLKEKFDHLKSAEIYFKKEASGKVNLTVKFGVAGEDITIKKASKNVSNLINQIYYKGHRLLNKKKGNV